jgi:hypothetical protein
MYMSLLVRMEPWTVIIGASFTRMINKCRNRENVGSQCHALLSPMKIKLIAQS